MKSASFKKKQLVYIPTYFIFTLTSLPVAIVFLEQIIGIVLLCINLRAQLQQFNSLIWLKSPKLPRRIIISTWWSKKGGTTRKTYPKNKPFLRLFIVVICGLWRFPLLQKGCASDGFILSVFTKQRRSLSTVYIYCCRAINDQSLHNHAYDLYRTDRIE